MTVEGDTIKPLVSMRYVSWSLRLPPDLLRQLAQNAESFYRPFDIPRPGRAPRRIDHPIDPLKEAQRRIATRLLERVALPDTIMGGVRRRSTKLNARAHVAKEEVVGLDIRDYFGSVTNNHIANVWQTIFQASPAITWLLTRLTTYKGHLPQGSPASTALANLVFLPIARELEPLCRKRGLAVTSWVDDITISGSGAREIVNDIAMVLARHGFSLGRQKTEVMPRHRPQKVTGHMVNVKVSNGQGRLRMIWGFLRSLMAKPSPVTEDEIRRARGLVTHAASTCPEQGRRLRDLLGKIEARNRQRGESKEQTPTSQCCDKED